MKTWTVVALLGVLVATSVASAQAPDLDRMDFVLKSVPDGPVAKVNGVSIPAEEFITLYRTELASIAMQTGKKVLPDEVRLEAALHSISLLVQREVLAQEATRRGIKVTSAEEEEGWKKEVENVGKRLSGGSGKIPTEAEMLEWSGLTKEEAMAEVHKEILIDKAREGIAKDAGVTVTDKEVAAFFEEKKQLFKRPEGCHLLQVFTGYGPEGKNATPEVKSKAREKIETALKRIKAGESFEAVAKSVSEAPDKDNGGDMGMLPMSTLPPFFVEAVKTMKPGGLSEIIESELGLHVIKLVAIEEGADADFEKAKPVIEKMLFNMKSSEAVDAFCMPILAQPEKVQVYLALEETIDKLPNAAELRAFQRKRMEASKSEK